MTLYRHELKLNRMSFVIWLVGVLAMSAGCIFLFPMIDDSMAEMSDAFASMGGFSAAFGMDKLAITTLEGFFGTEIGTIFALGGGMFASLIGISALSKEESSHTAEFLHTLTLSRSKIVDTALVRCQSFKFGKRFGKVISSFLVVPFVVIAQCHIRPKARVESVVAVKIVEQEQSLMVFGRLEIL